MKNTNTNELSLLSSNEYWGRGILVGSTASKIAVAYFIMGRSENSRNRYFYIDDGNIAIAPFDEGKLEDPSLIIYYPVKRCANKLIVTNGDQTDTIEDYLSRGKTFEDALRTRCFEPDEPHFTPRISAIVDCDTAEYRMSILKNIDGEGVACGRFFYEYADIKGSAAFIHTYEGNGNPLPTFEGEPLRLCISDRPEEFTDEIWSSLNDENKISLVTIMIDRNTRDFDIKILNKRMGD